MIIEEGMTLEYKGKEVKVKSYNKGQDAYIIEYDGVDLYVKEKTLKKHCEER